MIEPQVQPLIGVPRSWTPGTSGTVTADVVRVDIRSDADFDKYRGKLAGKIVLTQPVREVKLLEGIVVQRWNEPLLKEAMTTPIPAQAPAAAPPARGPSLADKIQRFFLDEHVAAAFDRGSDAFSVAGDNQMSWRTQRTDGGTIFPSGGGPRDSANAGSVVPGVTLAVEHYNRMVRILDKNLPVKVELDIKTQFHDETEPNGFNVFADLPGSDLGERVRHARRASRRRRHGNRRHRQRRGRGGDDGGDADPQGRRRQAAPHDSPRALGRRGRRAARFEGLRAGAPRRSEDDGGEARASEDLGVLQPRQRHRPHPRRVDAGQPRDRADLRGMDQAAPRPRRDHADAAVACADRTTCRSTTSGFRRFSSCRIGSSTTRERTIPTWTSSIGSSGRIWCRWRSWSRPLRTTPPCGTRSCRARRCRRRPADAAVEPAVAKLRPGQRPRTPMQGDAMRVNRRRFVRLGAAGVMAGMAARHRLLAWGAADPPAAPRFELVQPDLFAVTGGQPSCWADYDNDGDLDLFVGFKDAVANRLYRNDGGTFVEAAAPVRRGRSDRYARRRVGRSERRRAARPLRRVHAAIGHRQQALSQRRQRPLHRHRARPGHRREGRDPPGVMGRLRQRRPRRSVHRLPRRAEHAVPQRGRAASSTSRRTWASTIRARPSARSGST